MGQNGELIYELYMFIFHFAKYFLINLVEICIFFNTNDIIYIFVINKGSFVWNSNHVFPRLRIQIDKYQINRWNYVWKMLYQFDGTILFSIPTWLINLWIWLMNQSIWHFETIAIQWISNIMYQINILVIHYPGIVSHLHRINHMGNWRNLGIISSAVS